MRTSLKLGLTAGATLLAGVYLARSDLAESLGLDFWSVPKLDAELRQSEHREASLEARFAATQDRAAFQEELIDDLVQGTVSFDEVVDVFEKIHAEMPRASKRLRIDFPDATERELARQQVMIHLNARARPDEEPAHETSDPLDPEMEEPLNLSLMAVPGTEDTLE